MGEIKIPYTIFILGGQEFEKISFICNDIGYNINLFC
jgi:hypothetical protein